MISREVAWRVFATEYNASTLDIKGDGERAPGYVITPLGAKINRLLVVGVLTDKQNVGTDTEPMWRAMLSDGTDRYYVYAGKFSPEAMQVLANLQTPSVVAIVGKCRTYTPQGGNMYVSLRPEKIVETTEELRDYWIIETAKSTLKRIEQTEEALEMVSPSKEDLLSHGFSPVMAEGISMAIEHYGKVDTNRYRGMLLEVLGQITSEGGIAMPTDSTFFTSPEEFDVDEEDLSIPPEELQAMGESSSQEEVPTEQLDDDEKEELVLKLIDALDVNKKGAPLTELAREAAKSKISEAELEEITNSLLDKGLVYEPTIGKMKRI
ncbi:RPA family protein [Candidatus Methanomassiliicoccus intestinalis]|uniref:RPA family protein n=1 Tax=Candidatus Methanomassiliicoccus intestinalis TaxID=1406512 RepID=UPI0037DBF3C7